METRTAGNSDLKLSAVGLGCNNFGTFLDEAVSSEVINAALDAGVTTFDIAPAYGAEFGQAEGILGRALGKRRSEATIVTKFGVSNGKDDPRNGSRESMLREVDESLARLGTDYIDLYLLHWPDPKTPLEETLRALDEVVRAGKVRYIGACNLPAWQYVEADWISRTEGLSPFVIAQNEYSLALRGADTELIPALDKYGVGFMPYAPLANGLLTGKYSAAGGAPADGRLAKNAWRTGDRYLTPARLALADALAAFAAERDRTLLELAYAWLLSNPTVSSVIAGATRVEQIQANAAAGSGWRLTAEELAAIDQIDKEVRRAHR